MPRKPRLFVPGHAAHIVQRGNNRTAIFFEKSDYSQYLRWLAGSAKRYNVAIHAYVLMTNHVHLLCTPRNSEGISAMMQNLGREFVTYINKTYARSGTLWEGRFKACPVESERYTLACYRYIEMNPVRAGMVAKPGDYRWSSHSHNAGVNSQDWLSAHPAYLALGASPCARVRAYVGLLEAGLSTEEMAELRGCLQSGTPFGSERFHEEIEKNLGRRTGQIARGRPLAS